MMQVAEGCFRYLARMFLEIEECRAFELLRNMRERGDYLLTSVGDAKMKCSMGWNGMGLAALCQCRCGMYGS